MSEIKHYGKGVGSVVNESGRYVTADFPTGRTTVNKNEVIFLE